VRQDAGTPVVSEQFVGDQEKGWQAFQSKGCIECHSVRGESPSNPKNWPSRTFMQVDELMWNSAPAMLRAMHNHAMADPQLTGEEMTDVAAFVFALQYFDPPGSAIVGRSVFQWRRCSHCHGEEAQGTSLAPPLRGQGRNYNSISLATALWRHGRRMFQRDQQLGLGWPTLQPGDVGDLLSFLNSPMSQR
jgi:cytochrome c553